MSPRQAGLHPPFPRQLAMLVPRKQGPVLPPATIIGRQVAGQAGVTGTQLGHSGFPGEQHYSPVK